MQADRDSSSLPVGDSIPPDVSPDSIRILAVAILAAACAWRLSTYVVQGLEPPAPSPSTEHQAEPDEHHRERLWLRNGSNCCTVDGARRM